MTKTPLLLFLLVPLAASALSSPDEVTARDVETYKYGIDKGCRNQGAKRKDSGKEIDIVCGCALEALNATLTFKDWQEAYYADRKKQDQVEAKALQQSGPAMKACVAKARQAERPPSAKAGQPAPSLLGTWEWRLQNTGCREAYTFLPAGVLTVTSGAEKTDNTYELSSTPEASGRYKLVTKVTKDYGGQDCSKSSADRTGKSTTFYLVFNVDSSVMGMCFSETGLDCMGPLKKRSQN